MGCFVSFSRSAILFRSQNRLFCPAPFLYYYKSAVLSHFKVGSFVSLSNSAILSRFQNQLFCPTLKLAVLSRIRYVSEGGKFAVESASNSFDALSTANLPPSDFEENQVFFRKKPKFRSYLSNRTISVAFYDKFSYNLVIQKVQIQNRTSRSDIIINWQVNFKKRTVLSGWFSIHILIMGWR